MCVGPQREAGLHQDGLADDAGLAAAAEAAEDDGEAVGGRGLVGRGRAGGSTGAEAAAPQPPRRQRHHAHPHAVPRHPAPLRLRVLGLAPRPRPRPGLQLVAVEVVVADDVVGAKNKNNVNITNNSFSDYPITLLSCPDLQLSARLCLYLSMIPMSRHTASMEAVTTEPTGSHLIGTLSLCLDNNYYLQRPTCEG